MSEAGDRTPIDPEAPTEVGPTQIGAGAVDTAHHPDRIDRYRIRRIIGEGGMGTVYEAEQEAPTRTVALKVIRAGLARPNLLRRFEHEAQILGRLDHPGIATIYEAGTFDSGAGAQPFFAMEFVRGKPLTDYADDNNLGTRKRLELLAGIADAVQHAHQKGVIHRDLKPGNILVTESGQVKILDFGVARATDGDIQTTTLQTDIGQLIGTVPYMSPEQAAGDPDELDTRSDVYALGVISYELLAGRLPYDIGRKMVHEAVRIIREDDPTPLSSINRTFRGDVEIIVGKALQKDKDRRYQSASDLAGDIHRYLNSEPIVARRPSTWYQASRFAKRNKALVGGVAATMVVLVGGVITSTAFAINANEAWEAEFIASQAATARAVEAEEARAAEAQANQEAQARAEEAERVAKFQSDMIARLNPLTFGEVVHASMVEQIESLPEDRFEGFHPDEITEVIDALNFTDAAVAGLSAELLAPAVEAIDAQFASQPTVQARLIDTVGSAFDALGVHEQSGPLLQRAYALRLEQLGEENQFTIISLNNIASNAAAMGNYGFAVTTQRQVVEHAESALGPDHVLSVTARINLGQFLDDLGQFDEALESLEMAVERGRRALGTLHPRTIIAVHSLGTVLSNAGRYDEALPLLTEALEAHKQKFGMDSPDTLGSLSNTGLLMLRMGRLEEGRDTLLESLAAHRRVYGNSHPETLICMNNVGYAYEQMGELEEAMRYHRETYGLKISVMGETHPSTLRSLNNMAKVNSGLGRHLEALDDFLTVLAAREEILGPTHPDTVLTLHNITMVYGKLGRFTEGEPFALRAIEGAGEAFGAEHPYFQAIGAGVVEFYELWHAQDPDQGHDASAEKWRASLNGNTDEH